MFYLGVFVIQVSKFCVFFIARLLKKGLRVNCCDTCSKPLLMHGLNKENP